MGEGGSGWKEKIAAVLVGASYLVGFPLILVGGAGTLFGLVVILFDVVLGRGVKETISDWPGIPMFVLAFVAGCLFIGWPSFLAKLEQTRSGRGQRHPFLGETVFAVVLLMAVTIYALNVHQMDAEDSFEGLVGITQVSAFGDHALALRSDGTVMAVGPGFSHKYYVAPWAGITQVAAGSDHSVGLRSDGTVVAVGENEWGQCDVSDWKDIVQVAAGERFTIGLRSDGTALAVGFYREHKPDVSDWTDVTQIAAGGNFAVGLLSNGTGVADGDGSREASEAAAYGGHLNVVTEESNWRNIVQIASGGGHTVGLSRDGTVVETGERSDVSSWIDVARVAVGSGGDTVALLKNGTVVACRSHAPQQTVAWRWDDIAHVVSAEGGPFGLRSDGTVVVGDYASAEQVETEEQVNVREHGFVPRSQTIRWDEAKNHIGQTLTVEGVVVEVVPRSVKGGTIYYLNMGNAYSKKNNDRFQAIVWGEHTDAVGGNVKALEGKRVQITGMIKVYKDADHGGKVYTGPPEIEVSQRSQVKIADAHRTVWDPTTSAAP